MTRASLVFSVIMTALPFAAFAQNDVAAPPPAPEIAKMTPPMPDEKPPQNENPAPEKMTPPDPEVMFLTGIPGLDATDEAAPPPEEIVTYARKTYVKTTAVSDTVLRQIIRLSLARLEDNPADAKKIHKEHMVRISDFFLSSAQTAEENGDIRGAANAIQIAVRCNPGNAKAKLFWANLLHHQTNGTDEAIQTLKHGLEFLSLTDPDAGAYLDRYFRLLESVQRDREVAKEATTLLRVTATMPTNTREIIALHAATALDWIGEYPSAIEIIQGNNLAQFVQARLLEARAYFYGGKTDTAIQVLNKAITDFKGANRDAILGQISRFYSELGKNDLALGVTDQRIAEFPENPQPRVHRLYILEKLNRPDAFNKDLTEILNKYSTNQGAMIALANYASERGNPRIAETCFSIANQQNFNRQVFATLVIESLIRANQPDGAIAYHRSLTAQNPRFFHENEAAINALLGIAYLVKNNATTGRAYLDEFLVEKKLDPKTFEVISSQQRKISTTLYLSVGRLLRFANAPEDALRILENGTRAHPRDAQIKADYISARIICNATDEYGIRKSLLDEIDILFTLRRPTPQVWRNILLWLDNATDVPAEKSIELRAKARALARPDLTGLED